MSILVDFILGRFNFSCNKCKILQREKECLVDIVPDVTAWCWKPLSQRPKELSFSPLPFYSNR